MSIKNLKVSVLFILGCVVSFYVGMIVAYRTMLKALKEKPDGRDHSYRIYDGRRRESQGPQITSSRKVDKLVLERYAEATEIITYLKELIKVYGYASIADLYDMVGSDSCYMDGLFGWNDANKISYANIKAEGDGRWTLNLPPTIQVKSMTRAFERRKNENF